MTELEHAKATLSMAEQAATPEERDSLIRLAYVWIELARVAKES